ncbi:unnamed protein product [Ceutorhynchus assimilis]|uniref:Regulatory protein zeste n=1 Tax=Ceutorhynchus assimilis TaxID=467358 RepID=A0A9N9MSL8_9CUCU|nr:unnamed protein product [Ceutorhynchus assimilis]
MEKKRSANYTQREKESLISLVEKYLNVIENKKTNSVFNKQKNDCWEKLAWEYNSIQTTGSRTGQQLKCCYEQMKKIAKQHKSEDKVDLLKTGGGTFIPKTTILDEKILMLLKDNYFTIANEYDSNKSATSKEPEKKKLMKLDFITSPSTSADINKENIYIVYQDEQSEEMDKHLTQIEDDEALNSSVAWNNRNSSNIIEGELGEIAIEHQQKYSEPEPSISLLAGPKKRKIDSRTQDSCKKENIQNKQNKESKIIELNKKKIEVYNLKLNVLKTMAETELEHLKGAKLDNEIKELIKEKEKINLELKKNELHRS